MRVSAEPKDPGFTQYRRYKILLDGKELRNVITADDEEGLVVQIIIGEGDHGKWSIVERRGRVEIIDEGHAHSSGQ